MLHKITIFLKSEKVSSLKGYSNKDIMHFILKICNMQVLFKYIADEQKPSLLTLDKRLFFYLLFFKSLPFQIPKNQN